MVVVANYNPSAVFSTGLEFVPPLKAEAGKPETDLVKSVGKPGTDFMKPKKLEAGAGKPEINIPAPGKPGINFNFNFNFDEEDKIEDGDVSPVQWEGDEWFLADNP